MPVRSRGTNKAEGDRKVQSNSFSVRSTLRSRASQRLGLVNVRKFRRIHKLHIGCDRKAPRSADNQQTLHASLLRRVENLVRIA